MTEEELVNRMALRQLGGLYHEDDEHHEYNEHRFTPGRYHKDNHAAVVSDVAKKIARAAFYSEESESSLSIRIREAGSGFWDLLKRTVEKPGVKEGLIVAAVMAAKMSLWFAYRRASKEGLEIIDL